MTVTLTMFLPLSASATSHLDALKSWLRAHTESVAVIGGASMLLSLTALLLMPLVLARLPTDFFVRLTEAPAPVLHRPHPARVIGRTVLGFLLVLLGILLVPLPGPGALVALLGLAMADFPGKRRFLAAVLRRPTVMRSVNWLRRLAKREPMLTPRRFAPVEPAPLVRDEAADGCVAAPM